MFSEVKAINSNGLQVLISGILQRLKLVLVLFRNRSRTEYAHEIHRWHLQVVTNFADKLELPVGTKQ